MACQKISHQGGILFLFLQTLAYHCLTLSPLVQLVESCTITKTLTNFNSSGPPSAPINVAGMFNFDPSCPAEQASDYTISVPINPDWVSESTTMPLSELTMNWSFFTCTEIAVTRTVSLGGQTKSTCFLVTRNGGLCQSINFSGPPCPCEHGLHIPPSSFADIYVQSTTQQLEPIGNLYNFTPYMSAAGEHCQGQYSFRVDVKTSTGSYTNDSNVAGAESNYVNLKISGSALLSMSPSYTQFKITLITNGVDLVSQEGNFYQCKDTTPNSIPHDINTPQYYFEASGGDIDFTWTAMTMPSPASSCQVLEYRLVRQKYHADDVNSLANVNSPYDQIFILDQTDPTAPKITAEWTKFTTLGPTNNFQDFEGIHVFYLLGCTSAQQLNNMCRAFEIRIDAKIDCDNNPNFAVTEVRSNDVEYVVKSGQHTFAIDPFISSHPFSCPFNNYEWKQGATLNTAFAWPNDLVTQNQCASDPCKLTVESTDNQYAVVSQKPGHIVGYLANSTLVFWIELDLYVFYDCITGVTLTNNPIHQPMSWYTTSQDKMIRVPNSSQPNNTQRMYYPRVQVQNTDDAACISTTDFSNYYVVQQGYPHNNGPILFEASLANLQSWNGYYWVQFTVTDNSLVSDYVGCNLSDFGTESCDINFSVEIRSFNGTISTIASSKLTIESECLSFFDQQNVWNWTWAQRSLFNNGHRVGPTPLQFDMPIATPRLTFKTDQAQIASICGDLKYEIVNMDTQLFTLEETPAFGAHPQLTVQSNDPLKASMDVSQNYGQSYDLTSYRVTYEAFETLGWWFKYNTYYPSQLNFVFRDPCFGLTYPTLNIIGASQGIQNSPSYRVFNPVLQPTLPFQLPLFDYTDYDGFQYLCGDQLFNFVSDDNYRLFQLSVLGDQDEYDTRFDPISQSYLFDLESTNLDHVGNYTLAVQQYTTRYHLYPTQSISIQIEIQPCIINNIAPNINIPNLFYVFGDVEKRQYFEGFIQEPACEYDFTYGLKIEPKDEFDTSLNGFSEENLPGFVTNIYSKNQILSFQTSNSNFKNKTYLLYLTGTMVTDYPQYGTFQTEWIQPSQIEIKGIEIEITNSAPFLENIPDMVVIQAGQDFSFTLPSVKDFEDDDWWIADQQFLSTNQVTSWARYYNSTTTFEFTPPATINGTVVGVYVKLQDYHFENPKDSMSNQYTFFVQIMGADGILGDFQTSLLQKSEQAKGPAPIAIAKTPSTMGLFRLEFQEVMLMDPEIASWNSTEGNVGNDIFRFQIKWDQFMEIEKESLAMYWEVVEATPHHVIFQLSFENPEIISTRDFKDILQVKLLDQAKFVGANSRAATKFQQANIEMPTLSPILINAGQFSELPGQTLAFSLRAFMQANLILSIPIGGLLQYLWGFINSMQLIVLTIVFTVDLPIYTYDIFLALNQLVAFDIFQVEDTIYNPYFDFPQRDPLTPKFEEVGYDTPIYIIGIGSLFIAQVIMTLLNALRLIIKMLNKIFPNQCRKKIRQETKLSEMITEQIRFFMEGCIEISMNLYITLYTIKSDYFSYNWEAVSTIICLCTAVIMACLPIFLSLTAYQFATQYEARGKAYRQVRELYTDFRPRLRPALYYFIFIIRRQIFVISLVQYSSSPVLQVQFYLYSSLMTQCYFLDTRPYRDAFKNRYEIWSEFCVLFAGYTLFACTKASDDGAKQTAGYLQLGIIGMIFLVNMYLMIKAVIFGAIQKFKRFKVYRTYRNRVVRRHKLKLKYLERVREMNRDRGFENIEDDVHYPKEAIVENPFIKKGKGLDFVYDIERWVRKRQLKMDQIKREKIEKQQKDQQVKKEVEEFQENDRVKQEERIKQVQRVEQNFNREQDGRSAQAENQIILEEALDADFRDNNQLIEPKIKSDMKDSNILQDFFKPASTQQSKRNHDYSKEHTQIKQTEIGFVNHLEDPDPLNYISTFQSKKSDHNLLDSQLSHNYQHIQERRQSFEQFDNSGVNPYDQVDLRPLKKSLGNHSSSSRGNYRQSSPYTNNNHNFAQFEATKKPQYISEAHFSKPSRIDYPQTSLEAKIQGQAQLQRAQFEQRPENFAIQLAIKQRNDRTKVEMFKIFKKTGQKQQSFTRAVNRGVDQDPLQFLYNKNYEYV